MFCCLQTNLFCSKCLLLFKTPTIFEKTSIDKVNLTEKTMDVDFYRDAVLEMVLVEGRIPREVSELRCYLFLRAANSIFGRSSEVLQPFPSCFYDFVTKEQQYDDLKQCIIEIPKFSEINVSFFFLQFTLNKRQSHLSMTTMIKIG